MNSFTSWTDLASIRVGGKVILASDEFFAPKENLIQPGRGIFIPDKFTDRGKWMDGWESRRKRVAGHDWCILKMGTPGKIYGFDIDTNHFLGNHPPFASVEGCTAFKTATTAKWIEILPKSPLQPGAQNLFEAKPGDRFTHVRLNIYPDGGVARFRVYGEVLPDWKKIKQIKEIDLAALEHGGRVLNCNDMFFGPKENLILPGRAKNMGDGWETKRKRVPGYDWVIVQLGLPGIIQKIEVDTNHFKGNYPDRCSLDASPSLEGDDWNKILLETKLSAHKRHFFSKELQKIDREYARVRLNIYPDGGVSRLRVYGSLGKG